MKKDYILTFTMDDGTTKTVSFELPVAVVNASEISCTGFGGKTNVEDCLNWLNGIDTTSVTLISFTIAGTSYQAEDGMTWENWCNSSYNTGGLYVSGTNVESSIGRIYNDRRLVSPVLSTDTIISEKNYYNYGGATGN